MFGFDGDSPDVFRRTLTTLDDLEVDVIQVSIFTPLPGTPRAKLLADRIFDRDWENYDFHHAVFQPAKMSPRDLQAGHDWVTTSVLSALAHRSAILAASATARSLGLARLSVGP